jgi:hypothetical protein
VVTANCRRDEGACAAVRSAIEQLELVPRRHEVVFVAAAAPAGGLLAAGAPGRILALVEVAADSPAPEGARAERGGARIRLARSAAPGTAAVTPAWLVHAALRAAGAAGLDPVLEASPLGWGQLLARSSLPVRPSASDRALAGGIPAVRLVVPEGEAGSRWVGAVARRLDELAGQPPSDVEFLEAGGRVWTRRSLYWLGGALWVALVLAGRSGAWRRSDEAERRQRGRRYLRGLPFRVAFLLALVWTPALAVPLLGPAALATLWRRGGVRRRIGSRVLAWAPVVLLVVGLGVALATGEAVARRPGAAAALVILGLLAWELQARRPTPARAGASPAPAEG